MKTIKPFTYKVVLPKRKHTLQFFDTAVLPPYIRITQGSRTIYQRSNLFNHIQKNQLYYRSAFARKAISIEAIIKEEVNIFQYILQKQKGDFTLEQLRDEYNFYSHDLLYELDTDFKSFLFNFFKTLDMPLYTGMIKAEFQQSTGKFIFNTLQASLTEELVKALNKMILENAIPYLPFFDFHRKLNTVGLPVFPMYLWTQHQLVSRFNQNTSSVFPEIHLAKLTENIEKIVQQYMALVKNDM